MKNSIINSNPNLPFAGLYKTKFETAMSSNLHIPLSLKLPEILFITTIPPRQCEIATYSQDLIKALENKFKGSFKI